MGFTCGIAVLIFSTQIKDFLGLQVEKVPPDFVDKLKMLFQNLRNIDVPTVALGVLSILIIKTWPAKWGRRIPGSIVALILGTLGCAFFNIHVETIGSRYGGIPHGFPAFIPLRLPLKDFYQTWHTLQHLFTPALTIALLAAIESLLSAVVADGMIDDRHDPNQELMAQGLANIFSPLFGGIPATGAIARTATNVRSGGRSPVSGIVHAFHVAGNHSRGGAAGAIHPAGHLERRSRGGGVQHGRVAPVSTVAKVAQERFSSVFWRCSR